MIVKKLLTAFLVLLVATVYPQAPRGRIVKDLSNNNWKMVLDPKATWTNDSLYLFPGLKNLPVNEPTGGWKTLATTAGKTVHLPATVEQYHWGNNGNDFGLAGNYLGVSWFTTSIDIPASCKGKRLALQFESVRLRAEIFINQQLVGYDLVNNTPFEIDITRAAKYGQSNEIAVRITDPNGNFDWRDSQNFLWGNYRIQPTHGFGGITGTVKLLATDQVFVSDVFIKNKPAINEVDVEITTENKTGKAVTGEYLLQVKERNEKGRLVFQKKIMLEHIAAGTNTNAYTITLKDAKRWSVDAPDLYVFSATLKTNQQTSDTRMQRFGFRWFEVRTVDGDKQFYLNGKRFVARTSISWGFWPGNGMMPSDALAKKQITIAKKLGLNMLNFHRTIGSANVLDYADELGLLYFEEPGGNSYPAERFNATDALGKMQADFYVGFRNEKLTRMIRRDRNHPSLVIYNMHNERGAPPQQQDKEQMQAAHRLDETRILTYNSSNGSIRMGPDERFKLHLLPYDTVFKDYGWFDQHHAGGPGVYHDNLYKGPADYLRYTDHKDEISYYGEEGAIGTPPRLQLIRQEILTTGKDIGWESATYLKWYDAYDNYIKQNGFSKAFPTVDALTTAMGNVAYYYQGRAIENIRINNIVDGYAVNGWESMMLENHSGIVDNYRNPKGDVKLIADYNKPVYVAVKLNRKVMAVGDTSIADFYIVNEVNLQGKYQLLVKVADEKGTVLSVKEIPVSITGGSMYGELLYAGLPVPANRAGYTKVTAVLERASQLFASGEDQLYAVARDISGIPAQGMVADTSGVVASFLQSAGLTSFKKYKSGRPEGKYLVIGSFQPQQTGNPLVTDILEWVNEGNTLIVVDNIDAWADHLARKEVIDYRGMKELGTSWYGGNYFSKQHELFNGLPQAQVFNWEYQCFATYNRRRLGLRMFNGETIVGCVSDHKKEMYSALSIVPHGRGKIILCALDIFSCIKDMDIRKKAEGDGENAAMNTFNSSAKNKANIVGQQLMLNMLRYAGKE